jgi:site-specific DNA-methyltransferase (adenine-specific)
MEINKIYVEDCFYTMEKMPDKFVDCIITDPPYFLPTKHYATRKNFKRNFSDLGIVEYFFRSVFKEFARILKPTGSIYMFCDGQSYPLFYYYAYFFTKNVRPLIWDKGVSINGYGWRHQHEIILWGELPEARPIPTGDGDILKCRAVPVKERIHPAQKPEELIERLVLKSTKEGDLIYDPFSGSGTISKVCIRNKRNFIASELNPEYVSLGENNANNKDIQITKEEKTLD